jgi:hypothetical protein
MFWFDLHLGAAEQQDGADNAQDPLGAGGHMAKFAGLSIILTSEV